MGSHDYIVVFRTSDRDEVRKKWESRVEDDGHESGHGGYAGNATTMHGTITFRDLKLKGESEAREHILDNHEKWTGPLAVSFLLPVEPGKRDQARVAKALEYYEKVEEKQWEATKTIQAGFVGRTSKLVTCDGCDSKLSREHLVKKLDKGYAQTHAGSGINLNGRHRTKTFDLPGMPACPVCGTSLLSETDRTRLDGHKAKVAEAKKEYDETLKPVAGDKLAWAVGGWAAS